MSYFATVAGFPIVAGELLIPLVGAWTADVHLATANELSGPVEVVIGNLTLQGFVYRSQAYGGQTRARIVAGAGGWRTVVDKQGYGSSNGVKVSHILGDVASAVGETVNVPADASVGNSFTRAEAVASDVLWQLVSSGAIPSWYVDNAGTTQATYRPTGDRVHAVHRHGPEAGSGPRGRCHRRLRGVDAGLPVHQPLDARHVRERRRELRLDE